MHPNTKASMNVTKYKEVGSTMRMQKNLRKNKIEKRFFIHGNCNIK